MADVRHQKKRRVGCLRSDAVRSETYRCEIGEFGHEYQGFHWLLFHGDASTQVIFDTPAMSGGYYLDSAATRFSFNLTLQSIGATTSTAIRTTIYHQQVSVVRCERSFTQRYPEVSFVVRIGENMYRRHCGDGEMEQFLQGIS